GTQVGHRGRGEGDGVATQVEDVGTDGGDEGLDGDHVGLHRESDALRLAAEALDDLLSGVQVDLPGQSPLRDGDTDVVDAEGGQSLGLLGALGRVDLNQH